MLQGCDAVIFDLDGTLTDSAPGITAGVRHALTELGWPVPGPAQLRRHIGPPLEWGFREIEGMDAATAERARDAFRDYYRGQGWAENALYPGVLDMLTHLRDAGLPMVVATAKLEPLAQRITAHFGLDPFFDAVCGAGATERSADKREIVARARARLPRGAARPVVVGDREHDFHAAAALGLESVAALWGYGDESEWLLATARAGDAASVPPLLLAARAPRGSAGQSRASSLRVRGSSSTPMPAPDGTASAPS